MKHLSVCLIALALITAGAGATAAPAAEDGFHVFQVTGGHADTPLVPGSEYRVHQLDRPQPPRVAPGPYAQQAVTPTPSDATVLFDGTSLEAFGDSDWAVVDGHLVAGQESLTTRQRFGDCQLHAQWRSPDPQIAAQQPYDMGNSGIYFMWRYELQIFDSFSCKNYPDGSAGAVYGQTPPLVNASRPPGAWQTYDVVFTAPVFEGDRLVSPARITAFHNGVLIHNHTEILGKTVHNQAPAYAPHPARGPLGFQGFKSPVQFRNIWVRELNP